MHTSGSSTNNNAHCDSSLFPETPRDQRHRGREECSTTQTNSNALTEQDLVELGGQADHHDGQRAQDSTSKHQALEKATVKELSRHDS